jgi:predicted O-linked N-acetylglucosamine transferase (SPINDLY family)
MMVTTNPVLDVDAQFIAARKEWRSGRLPEAEHLCRAALRADPAHAETLNLLGRIMHALGRPGIGAAFIQKALAHQPDNAAFHRSLGATLLARHRPEEARASFQRALDLVPDCPKAHALLGGALLDLDRFEEAEAALRRAVLLGPERATSHNSLGVALLTQADVEAAIGAFDQARALAPDSPHHHSGLLFASHYVPERTREELFVEAARWGERHARPLEAGIEAHANTPDPDRRLRIGYVSADFHRHPVGYFLETVLLNHDKSQVEVFCYSNSTRIDEMTSRLQARADHWRTLVGTTDAEAAELVRSDGIDLLVDLSGHTGGNRLLLAARKPAPVQAMWLGYFDTTGIRAIDYVIADERVCPPDADRWYVESIARLPRCYLCYTPPEGAPEVAPLPADASGQITFGCFNNLPKVSAEVVALWSRILRAVPGSRMVLKSSPLAASRVRERYTRWFAEGGITADRLTFLGKSPHVEYLAAYGGVDIALDPFPYTGGTTTVDGLWMGVPAITLEGDRFVSRMGVSHLTAVGLTDFIVPTREAYFDKAVALAGDLPRLRELRATLREQVAQSPLCDGAGFTGELEAAFRMMWRTWCWSQVRVDEART